MKWLLKVDLTEITMEIILCFLILSICLLILLLTTMAFQESIAAYRRTDYLEAAFVFSIGMLLSSMIILAIFKLYQFITTGAV